MHRHDRHHLAREELRPACSFCRPSGLWHFRPSRRPLRPNPQLEQQDETRRESLGSNYLRNGGRHRAAPEPLPFRSRLWILNAGVTVQPQILKALWRSSKHGCSNVPVYRSHCCGTDLPFLKQTKQPRRHNATLAFTSVQSQWL